MMHRPIPPIAWSCLLLATLATPADARAAGPDLGPATKFRPADLPKGGSSNVYGEDAQLLFTNGEVVATFEPKATGHYTLAVEAFGMQAGPDPARLEIRVDGKTVGSFPVPQVEEKPGRFEVEAPLSPGRHAIAAVFTNDYYDEKEPDEDARDRNLVIVGIEARGPHAAGLLGKPATPPRVVPPVATAKAEARPKGPAAATPVDQAASDAVYHGKVAPLVAKYCGACHGPEKAKGELNLLKYPDTASVLAARKTWESVVDVIEGGEMPPKGKPKPTADESAAMLGWLQAQLSSADCSKLGDPGRVTLRRLNRVEYNNTVRDLAGVDIRPADDFPSDDVGYGFDNIGDVLSMPPILFEKYMAAAEKIAEAAIVLDEPDRGKLAAHRGADLAGPAESSTFGANGRVLPVVGELSASHEIAKGGDYFVAVKAFGVQAGPEPVLMEIRVDGKAVKTVAVPEVEKAPGRFEAKVRLEPGKHLIAALFTNDWYDPTVADPARRDRNLVVDRVEVQGPAEVEVKNLPKSHQLIIGKRKDGQGDPEFAAEVIKRFATRAYRRSVTKDEVDRLVTIYGLARKDGEKFERGIQLAVQAALMSPNFLFKIEYDRSSDDATPVPITDEELATRLSYFLWSSMPDGPLLDLARDGKLHDEKVLEEQARRMLKSRKSYALVENFAGQWLQLRNLKTVQPDPKLFPEFDESLRAGMLKETEEYFRSIKDEDRSILDFLDSDFTWLNARMARFYKIRGFKPGKQDAYVKWTLPDGRRGGVLTQASVLTVTSNATRTSPVKRGKYVLEQIFNTPPPPPPPGAGELKETGVDLKASLRTRMEQHRADINCAVCHSKMDPLGFGLENFNAIGVWRETESKEATTPIDASGVLPNGQKFNGPKELRAVLMSRSGEFTRCLSEKMMTYALGRGLDYYDRCAVDRVADSVESDGHKFSRLIVEIVRSDPFRKRRPKGADQ